MASIDPRQGPDCTYTTLRGSARVPRWLLMAIAASWSCFPAAQDVPCVESANCNRLADGVCRSAPSGNRWCSYPDSVCPSGYRYSALDVGDGLSGACTEPPGQPRWVQQVGGSGRDLGNGVAVDGDGNVIAVGTFDETLQIGGVTLTSAGDADVFVIKLNGITGDVIWARRFGGVDDEAGSAVRIDASNNIYVMGSFWGVADFGGGELRSDGGDDVFVLELTGGGDHIWSRRFGGAQSEIGHDFVLRGNAIAIVGDRDQPWMHGNSIQPHLGSLTTDIYIVMLTTDGELVWSKSLAGVSKDSGFGAALDSSGNAVVVGLFESTVNFGRGLLTSTDGSWDAFVVKYAGPTGAHLFSRRYGGTGNEVALSVTVDAMDNIVVVGQFNGTVDFGGPVSLTAGDDGDLFVAKYTLAGAYLWARSFHAMSATNRGYQVPSFVTVDDAGDVVLAGQFCGTISFGGAEMSSASVCFAAGAPFQEMYLLFDSPGIAVIT